MRKALTIAALLALLAVPFWAVAADNDRPELCHKVGGGVWRVIPPDDSSYDKHKDKHGDFEINDANPCPPVEIEVFAVGCEGWRVFHDGVRVDIGFWTLPYELETATSTFYDGVISEKWSCLQEPEPTATPVPTEVPGDCNIDGDGICPGDDDDPKEHPATGGEIDAGLAVVTALSGLALTGIGGSILFMKRRASR